MILSLFFKQFSSKLYLGFVPHQVFITMARPVPILARTEVPELDARTSGFFVVISVDYFTTIFLPKITGGEIDLQLYGGLKTVIGDEQEEILAHFSSGEN